MAKFVQIGNEILNLDQVLRVERAVTAGTQTVVMIYYRDDNEATQSRFTDEQAEAVWKKFVGMAEAWDVPGAIHDSPGGAGRVSREP